ncbi:hypothetical protein [Pontibaca salina]|uniref:Uncharacterized protein n=1 Tax=Pontibaca salina TaxID=2795731 RepID=A0A934M0U6_9RHOB|nr:hypothetical protein [Pontibaca salina]MBI6630370.1 hypothetical protein [Pontibaca salina]
MTQQNPKTDSADHPSQLPPDDYSILPHRDHVTQEAIPFILADYGDDGAFSEQQVSTLAERHNLSETQLRELSRLVGYSLDIDTEANLIKITRSKVQRRLNSSRLPKVRGDNSLDATEANALFKSLGLVVSVVEDLGDSERNDASETVANEPPNTTTISLDKARRVLQPDDRRKERDSRRLLVVESCCYVALDAGWPITYTTDSSVEKNQRGGRLIALIKDVIGMVSHKGHVASVHTLKADIEMVRSRLEMRGELP